MEKIIIYIIITIILIAVSARNSKKQQQAKLEQMKRQKKLQEEQSESSEDSIEDIFRKLGGDIFSEVKQQPQPVFSQSTEVGKTPDPFLDYELKRTTKSASVASGDKKKSPRGKKIYMEEIVDEIGVNEQSEYEINTLEEFKKAIIYSEIINRKYV
jgi:hypothetical protein